MTILRWSSGASTFCPCKLLSTRIGKPLHRATQGPQAGLFDLDQHYGHFISVVRICRPHITFISGANGSGKSAIMSALQVRSS